MTTNTPSATGLGTTTSPSPTPTRTGSPNPTLFSPGASPPLILAFLAIGLFTISMVAVFGWRRIQLGRGVMPHQWGNEIEFGERPRQGYGKKPKLWDLWTDGGATGGERDVGWDSIMPVAVMETPDPSLTHTPRPTPACSPSVRHRLWPLRTVSMDSDVKAELPPFYTRLQVAVAIAMPSPHLRDNYADLEHEPADKVGARVNYSIGLYHYAGQWRGEG